MAALFAGQGAQYVNMFEGVAMNWPPFRSSVSTMDAAAASVDGAAEITSKVLYPRAPYGCEGRLDQTRVSNVPNAQSSTVACALAPHVRLI